MAKTSQVHNSQKMINSSKTHSSFLEMNQKRFQNLHQLLWKYFKRGNLLCMQNGMNHSRCNCHLLWYNRPLNK